MGFEVVAPWYLRKALSDKVNLTPGGGAACMILTAVDLSSINRTLLVGKGVHSFVRQVMGPVSRSCALETLDPLRRGGRKVCGSSQAFVVPEVSPLRLKG